MTPLLVVRQREKDHGQHSRGRDADQVDPREEEEDEQDDEEKGQEVVRALLRMRTARG